MSYKAIVVVLPWLSTPTDVLNLHIELFQSLGCRVIVYPCHAAMVVASLLPEFARKNMRHILQLVQDVLIISGDMPVVFFPLSGSATVYNNILECLCARDDDACTTDAHQFSPVVRNFSGQIFDSAPFDVTQHAALDQLAADEPGLIRSTRLALVKVRN